MSNHKIKWKEISEAPPGTLIHIGDRKVETVTIDVLDYNEEEFRETKIKDVEELKGFIEDSTVTWINVNGIHDVDIIGNIGDIFSLHPLLQEDIVNTNQRPKSDRYENCIYIVLKMLDYDNINGVPQSEHINLVLGNNYVISFQERKGDIFDYVRDRIRNGKGRIRKNGADYLVYALMDTIVDRYFIILEKSSERIEYIEEEVVDNPSTETMRDIHKMKREMIFLRKSVWPLREVVNSLTREESELIQENTQLYFRDVYDHTIHVIDAIESFRDMVSGMLDIYLSSISNKMNEVMKVLTIFASIFIPLTFIAGIYGMNFQYMPELNWKWGYFSVLGFMVAVGISMLFYFKRYKWL